MNPIIGIIMGSDSDLPVMQQAAKVLDYFQIPYECTIVSAHRTPDRLYQYSKEAEKRGVKVIVAGAGGAAHLPGMVASITTLPVIGVPIKTSTLQGVDSLYSIVQMPPGIPVATMAINGSKNAALLAAQIVGIENQEIREKVRQYKNELAKSVEEKATRLEEKGYEAYLLNMEKNNIV